MKEYKINPNESYYENRIRLVNEGHVMGISYLPLTYYDFSKEHQRLFYKYAKKKSELSDYLR